jgi:hypothetical protein
MKKCTPKLTGFRRSDFSFFTAFGFTTAFTSRTFCFFDAIGVAAESRRSSDKFVDFVARGVLFNPFTLP